MGAALSAQTRVGVQSVTEMTDLRWSIAGTLAGTHPNVLSELHWSQVVSSGFAVAARHQVRPAWALEARVEGLGTFFGSVTDSDFASDDKSNRVFQARERAGAGHIFRTEASVVWTVRHTPMYQLEVAAGFQQGGQFFTLQNNATGLDSHYHNRWTGPLVRAAVSWQMTPAWKLGYSSMYQQAAYRAAANWNLISEFQHPVSFTHRARGFGWSQQVALARAGEHLHWQLGVRYHYATTGAGVDTLYRANGTTSKTRLNDVTEHRVAVVVGVMWVVKGNRRM